MIVNKEKIAFTPEELFDHLHKTNLHLWEEVLDAFIEIAQEKFMEHRKGDADSEDDCNLENGVDFAEGMITVFR